MKKNNGSKRGRKPAKKRSKAVSSSPQPVARASGGSGFSFTKAVGAGSSRARIAVANRRFSGDDRLSIALMLAPFMIVAASIAGQKVLRDILPSPGPAVIGAIDRSTAPVPVGWTVPPSHRDGAPGLAIQNRPLEPARPPAATPSIEVAAAIIPPVTEPLPLTVPAPPAAVASTPEHARTLVRRAPLPSLSPLVDHRLPVIAAAPPIALLEPAVESAPTTLAMINHAAPASPIGARPVSPGPAQVCHAKADLQSRATAAKMSVQPIAGDPTRFGLALAAAARVQLDDLVIYNARYARIGFPNGDVSPLFGVCTDVVVRAYRALDIDLQQLVQATRSGRGDAHIDHRRVEVLKRFFEKTGQVVAISDVAEDYLPGDVVTYYRPQNRTSTAHIAIVTDQIAPSGRPMIVHNRGWGPQLEDALFVDRITGHYRFSGIAPTVAAPVRGERTAEFARDMGDRQVDPVAASGKVASASRRGPQIAKP